MQQELELIAAATRRYGADPRYVFGGGGNTSWKDAQHLYIKPSGVALASMQASDLVKMSREAIRRVFAQEAPGGVWQREAWVKDMMAAAVCPDSMGRPSVEAPVHELFPYRFVIHTHATLVNGMTCSQDGPAACARLFPDAMWVEYIDPGYTLARQLYGEFAKFAAARGASPQIVVLRNHGIFVAADSIAEIDALYDRVLQALAAEYQRQGVPTDFAPAAPDDETLLEIAPRLRQLLADERGRAVVQASGAFAVAGGALTPDHIVYAKSYAFTGDPGAEALAAFAARHGYQPVVYSVPGKAVFAVGENLPAARIAMDAARNAGQVLQLTGAFGGPRYLDDRERRFIEEWEVEAYRKKMLGGTGAAKRLARKIVLVTGGAQGFGYGIAGELAAEGATLIVADLNLEGARAAAANLEKDYGRGHAFAVQVDVSDETSVVAMRRAVLQECGGLDVFVANAGVLKAGSVKTMTKADWDFVTKVNYSGYFLCVKHFSPVLARQIVAGKGDWTDIVQINSKSGLQGSNRNAAYAGGKFGGIGLTQSFALELIEDRIKVNSICPGNYFEGPLWSDPERGLFVQYLRSGKVPGAKNIEDVKKFYENKVPMGRGCLPGDVARAILYVIEQKYETGQAVPVTGGQVMLN